MVAEDTILLLLNATFSSFLCELAWKRDISEMKFQIWILHIF